MAARVGFGLAAATIISTGMPGYNLSGKWRSNGDIVKLALNGRNVSMTGYGRCQLRTADLQRLLSCRLQTRNTALHKSNFHLLGYLKGVVDLNPEVPDSAFALGVTK